MNDCSVAKSFLYQAHSTLYPDGTHCLDAIADDHQQSMYVCMYVYSGYAHPDDRNERLDYTTVQIAR